MNQMRKELKEFQEKDEDHFLSLLKDTFEEIKEIKVNEELVAFIKDVRQLMEEYSNDERSLITRMAFEATFDQLVLEKYGISLEGE